MVAGYLGFLVSSDAMYPIMYPKWPKLPKTKKRYIYENNLKVKFVVNHEDHQIFNTNYDWALGVKQNIEKFPSEVGEDHWTMYIDYRLHPDA